MCHFDHREKSYLFNILHMKDFSRSLSRLRGGARNDSLLGLFTHPSYLNIYQIEHKARIGKSPNNAKIPQYHATILRLDTLGGVAL